MNKNKTSFSITKEERDSLSCFVNGLDFDTILKASMKKGEDETLSKQRASVCFALLRRLDFSLNNENRV